MENSWECSLLTNAVFSIETLTVKMNPVVTQEGEFEFWKELLPFSGFSGFSRFWDEGKIKKSCGEINSTSAKFPIRILLKKKSSL